jgi:adenosylhomocysteine nucleosidase
LTTTAILSALLQEQKGLLALLHRPRKVQRAGRDFWLGQLHGHDVVLGLSRIGKVAAATTATTLIEYFAADRIVFTGVAGGLGDGVNVGDVVVASSFVQHDMDASPLFPKYQIPLYGQSRLVCDEALSAILLEAVCACLTGIFGTFDGKNGVDERFAAAGAKVHQGLITSGDRFVSSAVEAAALKRALQSGGFDALAVEMEGAAVAQVCFDYGIPYAALRTISDRADDTAHVDFPAFIDQVASRYALVILQQFLKML